MNDETPTTRTRHQAFRHAVVAKAPLYRALLEVFSSAKGQFVVHLRPDDVHGALDRLTRTQSADEVSTALEALAEWGNLRADPDTGRVTTVEDFNRARYLYSLTPEGEAAEVALAAYDDVLCRRGQLQAIALADIRALLRALQGHADEPSPDEAKVHQVLRDLAAVFEGLAANAQAFMSSLQRTIDLHEADVERFIAYKDQLIGYIERFIGDLVTISPDIVTALRGLDDAGVERLLRLAGEREARDAAPGEAADAAQAATTAWRHRWQGLRHWFLGGADQPAQAQLLRRRARQAITALLAVVATINERRSGRSDRSADFRRLAVWFAQAGTQEDCHRLWRAAFALAPARHLTVDTATIDAFATDPPSPSTPWSEVASVRISPRLRRTGTHERRGKPARIADRSRERALLAQTLAAEAAQTAAARARLVTDGPILLSELARLDRAAFGLFLELLGHALTRPGVPGEPRQATTADGSLALVLTPTGDGHVAELVTEMGVLRGAEHLVDIRDVTSGRIEPVAPVAAQTAGSPR